MFRKLFCKSTSLKPHKTDGDDAIRCEGFVPSRPGNTRSHQRSGYEIQSDGRLLQKLVEFQRAFAVEEESQSAPEVARASEFHSLVQGFNASFCVIHERQQEAFDQQAVQFADRHSENDARRESIFNEGQTVREVAYREEEARRKKQIDEGEKQWKETEAREQMQWKEAIATIELAYRTHFEQWMKASEERFIRAEAMRDEEVREIMAKGVRRNNFSIVRPYNMSERNMEAKRLLYDLIESSASIVYTKKEPLRNIETLCPAKAKEEDPDLSTYEQHILTLLPLDLEENRGTIQETLCDNENGTKADGDNTMKDALTYDKSIKQERHQVIFHADERKRNERFRALETKRGAAEAQRDKVFEEEMKGYRIQAESQLKAHSRVFALQEFTRAKTEHRREMLFDASATRMELVFRALVESVESYVDEIEDEVVSEAWDSIKTLEKRQMRRVEMTRKSRTEMFLKAQARRQRDLGLLSQKEPEPLLPKPSGEILEDNTFEGRHSGDVDKIIEGTGVGISSRAQETQEDLGLQRQKEQMPQLSDMSDEDVDVFLLYSGAQTSSLSLSFKCAPAPATIEKNEDTSCNFREEDDFELSLLDEWFRLSAYHRKHIFLFSELERAGNFVSAQHRRNGIFALALAARGANFQTAQLGRVEVFEKAEHAREEAFYKAEIKHTFNFYQAKRMREREWNRVTLKIGKNLNCMQKAKTLVHELATSGLGSIEEREQWWWLDEEVDELRREIAWWETIETINTSDSEACPDLTFYPLRPIQP